MTAKTTAKTSALNIDTKLLLPLACLLLGLIIMTVMYFQQDSRLNAANEQLITMSASLTAETAARKTAEAQAAALTTELEASNAALAAANALLAETNAALDESTSRLEECEAVLTTALEAIQLMRGEFTAE